MDKWKVGKTHKYSRPAPTWGKAANKMILGRYGHSARSLRPDIDKISAYEERKRDKYKKLLNELFPAIVVPEGRVGYENLKERYRDVVPKHVAVKEKAVSKVTGQPLVELRDPAPSRTRVLLQLETFKVQWQGPFKQGLDEYKRIVLRKDNVEADYLYFSGRLYFIVRDNYVDMRISRSALYNNRALLLRQYESNRLLWQSHVSYAPD